MKILLTETEFKNKKSNEKIPLKCDYCNNTFYNLKKHLLYWDKKKNNTYFNYCNIQCQNLSKGISIKTKCSHCEKEIFIRKSTINKSGHQFCSSSCSATYNNTHKKTGYRRSKLEIYIEEILTTKYINLEILFNNKSVINSELDIYIPLFKLAFELNGIFHYEPIFGESKINKIKNNDKNKFNLCQKNNISLCVIDTSSQKNFTIRSSQKFLNIITNIIDEHNN